MTTLATFAQDVKLRLAQVLQARLADHLPELSPSGIHMRVPEKSEYFIPGNHLDSLIYASDMAVLVQQYDRSSIEEVGTGDGETQCARVILPVQIRLIWSQDAQPSVPLDLFDRDMTQAEYYTRCAEAYKGSIINTLYSHAQGQSIHQIRLTSDFAAAETSRERLRAVALTEWEIETIVTLPMDTRYTQPASALITQ
jgi:hypothetical protein